MLKTGLYFAGRMLAVVIVLAGSIVPLLVYTGLPGVQHHVLVLYGVFFLTLLVGVVVHELGHLLACRAVGAEVKVFRLGGKRASIRFRAGPVEVSLGLPYQGRVEYDGAFSFWRRAVITLAGPFADLAAAGLVLAVSAVTAAGQGSLPSAVTAADGFAVLGLVNLIPLRTRSGQLTDGARLFELRSGIAAARLVAARRTAARLAQAGRVTELLELHVGLDVPDGRLSALQAANLALVELYVALLPERLPDAAARLAERRVLALARQEDPGPVAPAAYVTLALLRLRQGDAQGHAEAEQLCERALAGKDADDATRRIALAAVIMSRQARGLPDADVRAAAAAMPGSAGHSIEVMAAEFSSAFHAGPAARSAR